MPTVEVKACTSSDEATASSEELVGTDDDELADRAH
jgi:hypothetical protein